jgi:S-adenosylmethionine:tRNA ribosyltransferase-isomerase
VRVDLFDFDLPAQLIAERPTVPRDAARLLVVGADGALSDRIVRELPALLAPGDLLVFNDTRVIPARLIGRRRRGAGSARVEVTLHKELDPERWAAFARSARRLAAGDRIDFGADFGATVEGRGGEGEVTLRFSRGGPALMAALASHGEMPLPPYIVAKRPVDARDRSDYQTMFAERDGAVAAPTAGLHFTPALVEALERRGVRRTAVTLHVGAGTFLPVKTDDTEQHRMHAEWGEIGEQAAAAISATRAAGGRVVAVGSTALRLMESAADAGGHVAPFRGDTRLFITPGHRFKAVDVLLTNFHLPRSTLFMLVAAFIGLDRARAAYAYAIAAGYRFYSYGDACLLFRSAA